VLVFSPSLVISSSIAGAVLSAALAPLLLPMPTLSSILVQRGAASMRAVEDAIARQVFHGGDLATNLLELAALREEVLMPLVAESLGLEVAPAGRLALSPPDLLRLVPGDLALRHGLYPLALRERALVVAVAEPLAASIEDDLGFALDVALRQVVAPLVRIRQAIADSYGLPLDRRHLRLVAKLDGHADPSPSAMPPPGREVLPAMRMPRSVSIPSPSFGTGVPLSDMAPARLEEKPPRKTPFVAHAADFVNPHIPRSPALPSEAAAAEPDPGPGPEPAAPAPVKPKGATRTLAGVLRKALLDEKGSSILDKNRASQARPAWKPPVARRKGPFTAAMAEEELEEATTSDAVLGVLFGFAQQFFQYAALFVVHGDLAEGRDASGPGADRERVAGIGVPLDQPSSLARARERRGPVIGKLDAEGLDAELARDLGREARVVALLPVVVRARAVAIVYGDDGDANVELSALGDVIVLIGLAGAALERIALRRKLGARAPEVPRKVRIHDGAAALARAISFSALEAVAAPVDDGSPSLDPRPEPRAPSEPPAVEPEPVDPPAREPAYLAISPSVIPSPPVAVALFSSQPAPAFAVSPPEEENPLAVPPGPRTARYFDEPEAAPPAAAAIKRTTDPGLGIPFPDDDEPEGPDEREEASKLADDLADEAESQAPPTLPAESTLPFAQRPTVQMERVAGRRGPAPLYEGRAAAVPDGASVEWVGPEPDGPRPRDRARTLPSMGFEPLPRTPPPNATAWTSFPSPPPPASTSTLSAQRARSDRPPPIRREEEDSDVGSRSALLPGSRGASSSVPPLPSVVVDVGAEHEELVQRVIDGRRGQEAFDQLVRRGDQVVQAVMARFPGPLRVDRHRARAELPAASQCGPILELAVAIRRPALPFVSVRTSSVDPEVRFWATHVLGELRYPEAATVLVPRLFDDDASVRRIARRSAAALVDAGAAGAPVLRGLEDIATNRDEPGPHRVLAIETMGEIRSASMVPPLLAAIADSSEEISEAARRALLLVTRQDFGRDARRWHDWWAKNGERHRVEWLIDALMHEQPAVRRAAGDELKLCTKEYFGYYDDLPKRERERAQGLYRSWWEREGRQRFA
jgi:Type II secretion system (T2SS), protein E, N-terminal domain